ncbi:hypothetical protein [Mesorhizobium sp. CAU 1732]|uniref:hypothetical protein n=1 Tax=Mesorhizobium sp. CAU 1732 TaxID=3140358 RepID=UPI003260B566
MTITRDGFCRAVYFVEFLVLGVPTVLLLGWLALILGTIAGGAFFLILPTSIPRGEIEAEMALYAGAGLALAILGLCALWYFVAASVGYVRYGYRRAAELRPQFRRGLYLAAVPYIVLSLIAAHLLTLGDMRPLDLLLFSLPTLWIPVVHLGLAIHRREANAR